jgi:hypothetical protein
MVPEKQGLRKHSREQPENRAGSMTDPRIHLCKPLIGAMLLLWSMGSVSVEVCHSEQVVQRMYNAHPCKRGPVRSAGAPCGRADSNRDPLSYGLAYTADELRDRIRRIPSPSAVPSREKAAPRRSLGAVKGTEDYITATCSDLRLILVQLLRRVNALKKRENSTFSGLSETEKQELEEANHKLTALMTVLKARCSAPGSD